MFLRNACLFLLLSLVVIGVEAAPLRMKIEVDAREISRKLVHVRMDFEVSPGELALRYPEWIPGIHAPKGPIKNMAGFRIFSDSGERIDWERDPLDRYRFLLDVPTDVQSISVELEYVSNQPTTNSRGVDTYGNTYLGVINWNTLVIYPESFGYEDIEVETFLHLPESWRLACAVEAKESVPDVWALDLVTMGELVDSPAIFGEHLRSYDLEVKETAPYRLHVVSESSAAVVVPEDVLKKYGRLGTEADLLFGGTHFESYDFLVFCSDELPRTGLEHLKSSLNGIAERAFLDENGLQGWQGALLPHELVHSWCGKFRRPEGMFRQDFHTPKDTRLLWVYEGLTQHLGEVLTVRSGLWEMEHFRQKFANKVSRYRAISGREWRSLEDTAADSYHLRGGHKHWSGLIRGQDYYNEGLMFWLEVDSILREETQDKVTLDDFAESFLGADYPGGFVLTYDEEDLVAALNQLLEYDWEALIAKRITETQEKLPLEFIERLGYRLRYTDLRSDALAATEKEYKFATALDSLGISVSEGGIVGSNVVPEMPADKAGFAPRMKIIGVNDRRFSLDRFREAIADSVIKGRIAFLIEDGDRFRTIDVEYDGGLRYLELVRNEAKPDMIEAIYSPRMTEPHFSNN
ncbi:MAG: hypothetical protein AAGH40_12125 [Verrucomicrobiota bacterium]